MSEQRLFNPNYWKFHLDVKTKSLEENGDGNYDNYSVQPIIVFPDIFQNLKAYVFATTNPVHNSLNLKTHMFATFNGKSPKTISYLGVVDLESYLNYLCSEELQSGIWSNQTNKNQSQRKTNCSNCFQQNTLHLFNHEAKDDVYIPIHDFPEPTLNLGGQDDWIGEYLGESHTLVNPNPRKLLSREVVTPKTLVLSEFRRRDAASLLSWSVAGETKLAWTYSKRSVAFEAHRQAKRIEQSAKLKKILGDNYLTHYFHVSADTRRERVSEVLTETRANISQALLKPQALEF